MSAEAEAGAGAEAGEASFGGNASESIAIFMGDPSAEAEGVAQALRASSFLVVDVPLSMLVPRVAVQVPRVVVLDAEASEAVQLVKEVRALPGGQMIQVILLGGQPGGIEANADHALAEDAMAFFSRPVDVAEVVRKVELLTGGPGTPFKTASRPSAPPSIAFGRRNLTPPPPASRSSHAAPPVSSPPVVAVPTLASHPPPRISQPPPAPGSIAPLASGASAALGASSRRSSIPSLAPPPTGFSPRLSRQAPLSREIEQLLAEAEDRVVGGIRMSDSMFPSPDEELAAVLPADLLASLDQPLEEEEDDDEPEREAPRGTDAGGRRSITASGRRGRSDPESEMPERAEAPGIPPTSSANREPRTGTSAREPGGADSFASSFLHLDNPASGSMAQMPSMRSESVNTMPPSAAPGTGRESQRAPVGMPPLNSFGQTISPSRGVTSFEASARSYATSSPSLSVPPTPIHLPPLNVSDAPYTSPAGHASNQLTTNAGHGANQHTSNRPLQPLHQPYQAAPHTQPLPLHQSHQPGYQPPQPAAPPYQAAPQQAPAQPHAQQWQTSQPVHAAPHLSAPPVVPSVLGPGDAARALAHVIAARATGALSLQNSEGVRRIVLREGDVITAASGVDSETLLAFLGARGDLPRDQIERLEGKVPPFGRHAGAALVAHGHLRQDQLWPVLRAHAEWIMGRALLVSSGTAALEAEPPGRLRGEPSVFGGATGGEVFVESIRRVISPDLAVQRLGGLGARMAFGHAAQMLAECNLEPTLRERLERSGGETVGALVGAAPEADVASVLYALSTLGVFETMRSISGPAARPQTTSDHSQAAGDALDVDAVRARVRARLQLVEEGDYFELLGVGRDATGYEIRRAFLELRRAFEPARVLTPDLADLRGDVDMIAMVLDEAYEILRDAPRRDRYRRAIAD